MLVYLLQMLVLVCQHVVIPIISVNDNIDHHLSVMSVV